MPIFGIYYNLDGKIEVSIIPIGYQLIPISKKVLQI